MPIEQQIEIVAQALDQAGPVVRAFGEDWDGCGRLPSRGLEWRFVSVTLDDADLCVIAARERPTNPMVVEIRDVEIIDS